MDIYVIVGDMHFNFDPLSFYTTTSGAMQLTGYDIPSCSWKRGDGGTTKPPVTNPGYPGY